MQKSKDYEELEFLEYWEAGYKGLAWYEKVYFQLQQYLPITMLASVLIGYTIGAYFGKFW